MKSLVMTPASTVAEIACSLPGSIRIFDHADIDYSCRGARSLKDAAAAAGMTVGELMQLLECVRDTEMQKINWSEATTKSLLTFLTSDHRGAVDDRLPALP